MRNIENMDISKIDLGKLAKQLYMYEKQWIAVSEKNSIVANGKTYGETAKRAEAKGLRKVILFKVPPLDYSLAP